MGIPIKTSKGLLRFAGRMVLERRDHVVEIKTGRGVLPGARLVATKRKERLNVAVRVSLERTLSFSRHQNGDWRTLGTVDLVLSVVPNSGTGGATVHAFEAAELRTVFDRALRELDDAGQVAGFEMPVFVPLDNKGRKNVGHDVRASPPLWSEEVSADEMQAYVSQNKKADLVQDDDWISRVKQEFAKRNGVDVSKVSVKFSIED